MKILSKFSKGIKESRSLSFARSASVNCEKSCRQISGACYALHPEKQYRNYGKKLIRHSKISPVNLVNLARYELSQTKKIKWFRLSVSGSVPSKRQLSKENWVKLSIVMRETLSELITRGTKIHFPVESLNKANAYRKMLVGIPIVVRRTIQDPRGLRTFNDHCAFVVGSTPGRHNIGESFKLAHDIRKLGKTAIVCPAIKGVSRVGSKCGKCTACASAMVDLVIYPKH